MISRQDLNKVSNILSSASGDVGELHNSALRQLANGLIELEPRLNDGSTTNDDFETVHGARLFLHFSVEDFTEDDTLTVLDGDDTTEVHSLALIMKSMLRRSGAESALKRQAPESELRRLAMELVKVEKKLMDEAT